MKRMVKGASLFGVILVLLMLVWSGRTISVNDVAAIEPDYYTVHKDTNWNDDYYSNQWASIQAYTLIMQSFTQKISPHSDDGSFHYDVDGLYASDFPEYYGGAYININGQLVILIVDSTDSSNVAMAEKELLSLCGTASVLFKNARHSYSELIDCMTELYDFCASEFYKSSPVKIVGYGILDDRNAVGVYINSLEEKVLSEVRDHVNHSDCLEFYFQDFGEENTLTVNCGTSMKKSGSTEISIGYPAKYTSSLGDTTLGFITNGHYFSTNSTTVSVYQNSNYIGILNPNKKQYSGSVDAAFVMLSGSQISSQIGSTNYSVVLTGWVSVPVGGTAYICGRINQHQSGTVQSTSYVSNDSNDNVTLTNMVKATYPSSNGDSGGIIYAHNGGANFYTAGIQSRKASNSSYSVYCKVNVINSALGVSIN